LARRTFGRLRVVEATRCNVPLEILLGVGRFDPSTNLEQIACVDSACTDPEHHHAHHNHGAMFDTWSFETDRPMQTEPLREMIRRELPAPVYRCKGIVHLADAPDQRGVLQVVGRRVDVTKAGPWSGIPPRTRIVAIGAHGRLDVARLQSLFERCLVPDTTFA
jgi:G3E family GTPase